MKLNCYQCIIVNILLHILLRSNRVIRNLKFLINLVSFDAILTSRILDDRFGCLENLEIRIRSAIEMITPSVLK